MRSNDGGSVCGESRKGQVRILYVFREVRKESEVTFSSFLSKTNPSLLANSEGVLHSLTARASVEQAEDIGSNPIEGT